MVTQGVTTTCSGGRAEAMSWRLFRRPEATDAEPAAAASLYRAVVAQARQPTLYASYGVPDTLDGRFDLIALHMFLVLHRLKSGDEAARQLSQELFDTMFADMDRSLREMGVGDLGVGRRVRAMAEALYGRIAAYEAGLEGDDAVLTGALRRNLYGTLKTSDPPAAALPALCRYLRSAMRDLAGQALLRLQSGDVTFPAIPPL
jgi:cytochrome b pre-mRNA-processing protein 3